MSELKFIKGMSAKDIFDMLNEYCYYDNSNSDTHIIQNLYKNYEEYPRSTSGAWTTSIICSYKDFIRLYEETGGVEL